MGGFLWIGEFRHQGGVCGERPRFRERRGVSPLYGLGKEKGKGGCSAEKAFCNVTMHRNSPRRLFLYGKAHGKEQGKDHRELGR